MSYYVEGLAHALQASGVRHCFGVAGGGISLDLIGELTRLGVAYHPVAHEAAAALAAGGACHDGVTRACALSIKGPGFANMIPAMVSNTYECRPAISVSEAYPPEATVRWHKDLDHQTIFRSIGKAYGFYDGDPATVGTIIAMAQTETPGPVHLDIAASGSARGSALPEARPSPPGLQDERAAFQRLADLLSTAKEPAVILGSLVTRLGCDTGHLTVPVSTTAAGKGAYDEGKPYSAGVVTGEIGDLSPESAILSRADLVIGFGLRGSELVRPLSFDAPLVIVDLPSHPPDKAIKASHVLLTHRISEALGLLASFDWGADLLSSWRSELHDYLYASDWSPAIALRSVRELLGSPVLVCDTGLFCIIAETEWPASSAGDFVGSSVARFMGTAIPTALGVAAGFPKRKTVCVVGDGGLRPYLSDLHLAAEEQLDVVFVVLSDGQYGTFAGRVGPTGASEAAVNARLGDACRVAEGLGLRAFECRNAEELSRVLGCQTGGPSLVNCVFDPVRYVAMTARLR